jgi:hypothetical protein
MYTQNSPIVKITNFDWFTHEFDTKYDLIVTNPPYGSRGFNINSYKFMEKFHNYLNPNGILCILLPDMAFKNSDIFKGFDKLSVSSVKDDFFEHTSIKSSIGIFQKSKVSKRKYDSDSYSTPVRCKFDVYYGGDNDNDSVRCKLDFSNIDFDDKQNLIKCSNYKLIQHETPRIQPFVKCLDNISIIYSGPSVLSGGDYVVIKKHKHYNNILYLDEPFYQLSKNDYVIKAKNEDSFFSTRNIYNYLMKNKHLVDNLYMGNVMQVISKPDLEKLNINLN